MTWRRPRRRPDPAARDQGHRLSDDVQLLARLARAAFAPLTGTPAARPAPDGGCWAAVWHDRARTFVDCGAPTVDPVVRLCERHAELLERARREAS